MVEHGTKKAAMHRSFSPSVLIICKKEIQKNARFFK